MILLEPHRLCLAAALVGVLAAPGTAGASPADLCLAAARSAAAETGVPLRVLLALTLTETGRADGDGALLPWPWTLNKGGEGLWFDSRDTALAHLETALAEGATNVDVGCFQLNHRWHAQSFDSLTAMLDPEENALYAARYVFRLYQDTGDWTEAAAAYHSGTPEYAERYLARFEPIYAALDGRLPEDRAPDPVRENRFPLLLAGTPQSAGSLVPMSGAGIPLIGGP
ncbi:transglycosylase SLT domain-containing protein [Rhodobacter sp. Har01]|uniref:transglycosylase SLT domain-containing protein n=1 Tax=Rhodobacter sp. Har01 TaxID=2883999 RepID=UPI001D07511B|nr:transglycosylase SLT domain-containing protein [Rhodobacter sp. Har01]MCB6177937.1 transglycosylase SLT domain-containing protein [Rhodobacter sp. Har01]